MNFSNSKVIIESIQPIPIAALLAVSRDILSCDANIEYCASEFSFHSTDALRCFSRNAFHTLFSSESLRLENEDFLLRTLLEFGKDSFESLKCVELIFLNQRGIALFAGNFAFSALRSDLWSKIVRRLKGDSDENLQDHRISGERQQ
jgi:hypothetical protein